MAKSGALLSAVALSGFTLSRNAASVFNCESLSWMGGMEEPGRTPAGLLKCWIIQAAVRGLPVRGKAGPMPAGPRRKELQLGQFSARKEPTPALSSGGKRLQSGGSG